MSLAYRAAIDTYKRTSVLVLPQFCRDEVNKVTTARCNRLLLRQSGNGYITATASISKEYEVVGMPVEDDSGAKPRSAPQEPLRWEELELIQPGQAPYVFRAENVTDDEGTKRELFNVPQMRVHFAFPFKVSEWAILRKVKERPE